MRKVSRWQLSGVPMLGLASILEQTVKSLHEANEHPSTDASEQYTILDGLKLLSDDKFRSRVLAKVSDPYLLEWRGRHTHFESALPTWLEWTQIGRPRAPEFSVSIVSVE